MYVLRDCVEGPLVMDGTTVSVTVLSAMDFWDIYMHGITSLPSTSKATVNYVAQSLE